MIVLVNQCDDMMGQLKLNKKLLDSGNRVELSYPRTQPHCTTVFPSGLPLNVQRLKQLQCTGEFSDVSIYIQGHGFVAHVHKIILSLWSMPFERVSNRYCISSNAIRLLLLLLLCYCLCLLFLLGMLSTTFLVVKNSKQNPQSKVIGGHIPV